MNIIWYVLIGLFVALLARLIIDPKARYYEPWGIFFTAIFGAILFGILFPASSFFLAPFVVVGGFLTAFFGSILVVWLISLLLVLFA